MIFSNPIRTTSPCLALLTNQHTELMTEMEESFVNNTPDSENNDTALELRRWQQWRDTEPAGPNTITETGSAGRPIEIDGAAEYTATTTPNGRGRQDGDSPLDETETLWGHAVHEHELCPGDQVRHSLFSRRLANRRMFPGALVCTELVSLFGFFLKCCWV